MNLEAYNALPNDLKAIMNDAAQKAHDNEMKRNALYVDECWSKLSKSGMEVYTDRTHRTGALAKGSIRYTRRMDS